MKTGGRTLLIIFALLSLAHLGLAARPSVQTPSDLMARLKEGKPGYTEAQARSYVRELIPLVEKPPDASSRPSLK